MLQHTIHLQQKQDAPTFINPAWYTALASVFATQSRSVRYAAKHLELPEFQVREAVYDLYRQGALMRRERVNEKGRVYLYRQYHEGLYNDGVYAWYLWDCESDYDFALKVISRFANPVTIQDVSWATGWTLDHTKRIINELWRARRLERERQKVGKSWWYDYEVRS
jgi:hypothetical protein